MVGLKSATNPHSIYNIIAPTLVPSVKGVKMEQVCEVSKQLQEGPQALSPKGVPTKIRCI